MKRYVNRQPKLEDFVGRDLWIKVKKSISSYDGSYYIHIQSISDDILICDMLREPTVEVMLLESPGDWVLSSEARNTILRTIQGRRPAKVRAQLFQVCVPIEVVSTQELLDQLEHIEVRG